MALINKTGITTGGTIQAEHITRAIDALSGGSTDSVSITGSLMGSASYALTASYALNGGGSDTTINASDTVTGIGPYYPVFVASAGTSQTARVDTATLSYNATINNLTTTASFAMTSSYAMAMQTLPAFVAANPAPGTMYIDLSNPGMFWIYDGSDWFYFQGTIGTP